MRKRLPQAIGEQAQLGQRGIEPVTFDEADEALAREASRELLLS
ncbi:MAG TPA: hypothetical protein VEL12_15465 [Candidatus Nitrosopolaris sp.]|nr:hypothetical protein [Candidatus Nitrosopolaris sp.]